MPTRKLRPPGESKSSSEKVEQTPLNSLSNANYLLVLVVNSEVGCPVRLSQLLSLFFPAFAASDPDARGNILCSSLAPCLGLCGAGWFAGQDAAGPAKTTGSRGRGASKRKKTDLVSADRVIGYVFGALESAGVRLALLDVARAAMGFLVDFEADSGCEVDAGLARDVCRGLAALGPPSKAARRRVSLVEIAGVRDMFGDVEDIVEDDKMAVKAFKKFKKEVESYEPNLEMEVAEEKGDNITTAEDVEVEIVVEEGENEEADEREGGNGKGKVVKKGAQHTKGRRSTRGKVLGEVQIEA